MLTLLKSVIPLLISFILSVLFGLLIIPYFRKIKASQNVSKHLNERHLKKQGTPTMGGLIFVIPTLTVIISLLLNKSINMSLNFIIILITFLLYMLLGFADDYLKIRFKNNSGLSIITKFLFEVIIAIIFFYLYLLAGNNTIITILNYPLDIYFLYGFFILFLLVGTSNAVNITDGLDGLCAGLCSICFLTYGIIAWNSNYIIGYEEIAIFCFTLTGALLGFLFFNFYPAKIFMGDLGSLALGAALASVAIILKKELSLIIICFVFIIETLSSFIQIISIRYFNKKIFKKSPLHHHFEMLDISESNILKLFYLFGMLFCLIAIILYVWI